MYLKNVTFLKRLLNNYKEGKVELEIALQGIQNVIGEEIERKDVKSDLYAVEEESCPKV